MLRCQDCVGGGSGADLCVALVPYSHRPMRRPIGPCDLRLPSWPGAAGRAAERERRVARARAHMSVACCAAFSGLAVHVVHGDCWRSRAWLIRVAPPHATAVPSLPRARDARLWSARAARPRRSCSSYISAPCTRASKCPMTLVVTSWCANRLICALISHSIGVTGCGQRREVKI